MEKISMVIGTTVLAGMAWISGYLIGRGTEREKSNGWSKEIQEYWDKRIEETKGETL